MIPEQKYPLKVFSGRHKMACNMKANDPSGSGANRVDRMAALARERRDEAEQMADVANNQVEVIKLSFSLVKASQKK